MRTYTVYLLTNKHRTVLYCGVTNNLVRRLQEHQSGLSAFSRRYLVHHLIWFHEFDNILDAIQVEKRMKRMTRSEKEQLIQQLNPNWTFLESQ